MNKEITIFTEGDSNTAKVWSNIPYYLTNTLESVGYTVHRVNVFGNHFLRLLYDNFFCRILRHTIMPQTTFAYERSFLYRIEHGYLMKRAVRKYPNTDYFISTSFSFAPVKYTSRPCSLFCDWTYEYYFTHFLKRKPDFLEALEVRRQNALIEQVDHVFVLFPDVASYMQKFYKNEHIYYLGNVINSDKITAPIPFIEKQESLKILFIGLKKYKEGVMSLIQAITILRTVHPGITLDVIGMDTSDLSDVPAYVTCHGYLSKDIPEEKELYNSILVHAALYVNTTPIWAGFSSALEALYHYVPIITTPYNSFIETFGKQISFGTYCDSNKPSQIAAAITTILQLPSDQYSNLCEQAHSAVLDFTWEAYVNKLINTIEKNES